MRLYGAILLALCFVTAGCGDEDASVENPESPQMRVGSGGASSMPPQQRNSIEINAPGEWKP